MMKNVFKTILILIITLICSITFTQDEYFDGKGIIKTAKNIYYFDKAKVMSKYATASSENEYIEKRLIHIETGKDIDKNMSLELIFVKNYEKTKYKLVDDFKVDITITLPKDDTKLNFKKKINPDYFEITTYISGTIMFLKDIKVIGKDSSGKKITITLERGTTFFWYK